MWFECLHFTLLRKASFRFLIKQLRKWLTFVWVQWCGTLQSHLRSLGQEGREFKAGLHSTGRLLYGKRNYLSISKYLYIQLLGLFSRFITFHHERYSAFFATFSGHAHTLRFLSTSAYSSRLSHLVFIKAGLSFALKQKYSVLGVFTDEPGGMSPLPLYFHLKN